MWLMNTLHFIGVIQTSFRMVRPFITVQTGCQEQIDSKPSISGLIF